MADIDSIILKKIRVLIDEQTEPNELQHQTIVYDLPKKWLRFIKSELHSTISGYARTAIREKLEKDGLEFKGYCNE